MGIFDKLFGKKEVPSEPKKDCCSNKEVEEKNTIMDKKVKVKIPTYEFSEDRIIIETTLEKLTEQYPNINNKKSDEEGIDFDIDYIQNPFDFVIFLESKEKFVCISQYDTESECGKIGEKIYFEFLNCDFPEEIKTKYKIGYGNEYPVGFIGFIDSKPIETPEIFKDDPNEEVIGNLILYKYEDVDFEKIIKNCDPS
tara:strand:+ start:355 stop:945 length:591 start_codon:yes stop_codon:yes gene_type:complete